MRTTTHRFAGTLVAGGFLAGWLSASLVSPPAAVTQVRPPRPAPATPAVSIPRLALTSIRAPQRAPSGNRNPFLYAHGRGQPADAAPHVAAADMADSPRDPDEVSVATGGPGPVWRLVGMAVDAVGHHTAVVSGAGGVHLIAVGDRLPDGSAAVEVGPGGLVIEEAGGERRTLRLP